MKAFLSTNTKYVINIGNKNNMGLHEKSGVLPEGMAKSTKVEFDVFLIQSIQYFSF